MFDTKETQLSKETPDPEKNSRPPIPELPDPNAPAGRRILITGSRKWVDADAIEDVLEMEWRLDSTATLVSGACPSGADKMAEDFWRTKGGKVERHPADWSSWGQGAGRKRNAEMVRYGADILYAFILDSSPGSIDCMERALEAGIPTAVLSKTSEDKHPLFKNPGSLKAPTFGTAVTVTPTEGGDE